MSHFARKKQVRNAAQQIGTVTTAVLPVAHQPALLITAKGCEVPEKSEQRTRRKNSEEGTRQLKVIKRDKGRGEQKEC